VLIPLEGSDVEPMLDLQGLLNEVYEQAGFDLTIIDRSIPNNRSFSKDSNDQSFD
jgi:Protein of unknown function (DUF4058)